MKKNHKSPAKSQVMILRVEPSQKAEFKRAAKDAGIELSEWVRLKLLEAAARELKS